jgi:hypothetical protein
MKAAGFIVAFALGALVGGVVGGLVGEMGGAALGGVAAICKAIDTGVTQSLVTQDQANRLAKSLLAEFKVEERDLKGAIARLNSKPDKTPCSEALSSL